MTNHDHGGPRPRRRATLAWRLAVSIPERSAAAEADGYSVGHSAGSKLRPIGQRMTASHRGYQC